MLNSKGIPTAIQTQTVAKFLQRTLATMLLLGAMAVCASGQNIVFTQGTVGSGLDKNIHVQLQTYPGRGGTNLPVTLSYSSRLWRIGAITTILNNQWSKYQTITEAIYAENSVAGWRSRRDREWLEQLVTSVVLT